MQVGICLGPLLQSLQEPTVVGLEHFKRDDYGEQAAGNAEVIEPHIEESQNRLAPQGGDNQETPHGEGSDQEYPMRAIGGGLALNENRWAPRRPD